MNLLVKYKELFGLPIGENASLETLCDRAHIAWERWHSLVTHLHETQLRVASSWTEIRELGRRVETYRTECELACKAAEERLKREARKMQKRGETHKIFEGQLVVCSIVLDGNDFLIRRRLLPRE